MFLLLLLLNIPIFIKIKNYFYPDPAEFSEALRFMFTPDFISLFRGEYVKDRVFEFKLGLLFMAYLAVVGIEYAILSAIF